MILLEKRNDQCPQTLITYRQGQRGFFHQTKLCYTFGCITKSIVLFLSFIFQSFFFKSRATKGEGMTEMERCCTGSFTPQIVSMPGTKPGRSQEFRVSSGSPGGCRGLKDLCLLSQAHSQGTG